MQQTRPRLSVRSKLFFLVLSLLLAGVMIVSVSFAWLALSRSPAVNGISVTLGGGKTILLAPDRTEAVQTAGGESRTVHYPGEFSETLSLSADSAYANLSQFGGLSPVSTADGQYFLIPQSGAVQDGSLEERFFVDDSLTYANGADGLYAYLDFWVVSPGQEYALRVSTDAHTGKGSFLVGLPSVKQGSDGTLSLAQEEDMLSALCRVGFLANTDRAGDAAMTAYTQSAAYNARYRTLAGVFTERGEKADPVRLSKFTIYEPNALRHADSTKNGGYLITSPLRYDPFTETISTANISDRLAVQSGATWKSTPPLSELFSAAMLGHTGLDAAQAQEYFYGTYLQNVFDPYLKTGLFVRSAATLYEAAQDGTVSAEKAGKLAAAGAPDDAEIVTLQRNVPQRIRMFLWLEGQDGDCAAAGAVEASQIALRLEFAGA